MSRRFGSISAECKCGDNFTCGYCLRNAKPWIWTDVPDSFERSQKRFLAKQKADEQRQIKMIEMTCL